MKAVPLGPAPAIARRDRVLVTEEHRTPWEGRVLAVKPSSVSGWWVEAVDRHGLALSVPAAAVEVLEPAGNLLGNVGSKT